MEYAFDVELSERELLSIGRIVALWGALEYEIFLQTLTTFAAEPQGATIPKAMNNMQFSEVLDLWETRVVQTKTEEQKAVLQGQYKAIRHYQPYRDALVHGMWDWSETAPEKITAIRAKKREIIRTHFTGDDLSSFASTLETINFNVRYPGGFAEFARLMGEKGQYISRRWVSLMTNSALVEELFPSSPPATTIKTNPPINRAGSQKLRRR